MNMRFTTESGSEYEYDPEGQRVRRSPADGMMRRDYQWVDLLMPPTITVGSSAELVLEPLGEGNATIRTTSPVTHIEDAT